MIPIPIPVSLPHLLSICSQPSPRPPPPPPFPEHCSRGQRASSRRLWRREGETRDRVRETRPMETRLPRGSMAPRLSTVDRCREDRHRPLFAPSWRRTCHHRRYRARTRFLAAVDPARFANARLDLCPIEEARIATDRDVRRHPSRYERPPSATLHPPSLLALHTFDLFSGRREGKPEKGGVGRFREESPALKSEFYWR